MNCLPAFTANENYRIMERILGFTDANIQVMLQEMAS